jgi:hypothetical protein
MSRDSEHTVVPAPDVRFEPFEDRELELPEFIESVVPVARPWVTEELVLTSKPGRPGSDT